MIFLGICVREVYGMTTFGAIPGWARDVAGLDFHFTIPQSGVIIDEDDVNDFVSQRVLPDFVEVVGMKDIKDLFSSATG